MRPMIKNELHSLPRTGTSSRQLVGWVVWGCAAVFYGFQFLLRVSPSVIAQELMSTLAIDACTLGTLTSFYYYGYATMQIPSGIILDRMGPRRPLVIACLLCTVGCALFGFAESLPLLSVARTFMGVGSAFAFLSCVKLASFYFDARILSILVGLTMSLGTIGATLGDAPLGLLVKLYDWRVANYVLAGISVVIALAAWFLVEEIRTPGARKRQAQAQDPVEAETSSTSGVLESFLKIISNPQAWIYGGYGFAMYVPLSGFADLWGTPFLSEAYHLSPAKAAGIKSFFYIGLGVGAPLWSFYMTRLQSYKNGLLQSAIAGALAMSITLYVPLPLVLMSPLLFLSGFSVAGQFAAFAAAAALNKASETATSSGVHNMICMLSGIVMQPLIGYVLDTCREADVLCPLDYTYSHFLTSLSVIPISLVVAVIFCFFMKETFPRDA